MKALTLVEMLLVMVLLVVAAAISVPNFSKAYAQLQLQNTANTLMLNMRYAQSKAITQNKKVRLSFDKSFKSYRLLEADRQDLTNTYQPLKGKLGKTISVPKDMTITSLKQDIHFLPSGEIDKTDMNICRKNDCLSVTTSRQRGQIEMFEGP